MKIKEFIKQSVLGEQRPVGYGYAGGGSDNLARTGRPNNVTADNVGKVGGPHGAKPTPPTTPTTPTPPTTPTTGKSPSPTIGTQGTQSPQSPQDMQKEEPPTINVRSGQTLDTTVLKKAKAIVTPGDAEIEFDDGSGNKFKLPQELFIDEQIEDLKKLSGIEK
jgi:hypothetical protein